MLKKEEFKKKAIFILFDSFKAFTENKDVGLAFFFEILNLTLSLSDKFRDKFIKYRACNSVWVKKLT